MIKTVRVMLIPNNKQNTKLFECAGVARYIYNWTLNYQKLNYEIGNDFLSDNELRKTLTVLKATNPKFAWLNCYSNNIAKQAVKDACKAYINFFKGKARYPRFKSKKRCKPSFYVDTAKIRFTSTHVILEKLTESKKKNKQK
ncbi:helix-turn-helix domain-containing protein, partial [bacterium]|nr:helix-turn-helix domain-containing protein [bacterium]